MNRSDSDILIDSRRSAYMEIERIVKSDSPDKLSRCMTVAKLHCAITGDDSLIHPVERESYAELIGQLPDMITRAKAMRKERESGQVSLI